MSSNDDDLLDWLATQYLLGELTESDSAAFELRLEEDLAACEAVARATQLTHSVHAALAESAASPLLQRPQSYDYHRPRIAMGVSIASIACLFAVMIYWSGTIGDHSVQLISRPSNQEASELVARWQFHIQPIDDDSDDDDDDDVDSDEVVVPGWLLAGVQIEKRGAAENLLEELQEN